MSRKTKPGSKKSAKVVTPTLIDGLTKDEISKDQLKDHIVRLREELDREREERNYFQLERDKIQKLREVTQREVEEAKAERENLDKKQEEDERRHQLEIKVIKQKMKHLLCEHQNTLSELEADGLVSMEAVQEEQQQLEAQLHEAMGAITEDMRDLGIESQVTKSTLEQKHAEELTEARNRSERQLAEVEANYYEKEELLKQKLENLHNLAISEKGDKWNSHINTLMENHKAALDVGHELKLDELETVKKLGNDQEKQAEKTTSELAIALEEKKLLAEKLLKLTEEMDGIKRKTKYHRPKKAQVTLVKIKEKEQSDLQQELKALQQKFTELQLERDELRDTFTQNLEKVQQKADVSVTQLEKKLEELVVSVEERDTQLAALLSVSNADQTTAAGIIKQLEDMDKMLKDLKYKKTVIATARRDLIRTTEEKMFALGVPAEQRNIE